MSVRLQAKDMGLEDTHSPTDDGAPPVPSNFTTITPLVVTPHCHGPSCLRQELWNEDTGEVQSSKQKLSEGSQRFHNHGEGPLLLVESAY